MTPIRKSPYYYFTYDKKFTVKNKLLYTVSAFLIAGDINSWAAGKCIDLSSHPEIKCHVDQLFSHCYSSMFFPSLEIFFFCLTLRIKMHPLFSAESWQTSQVWRYTISLLFHWMNIPSWLQVQKYMLAIN